MSFYVTIAHLLTVFFYTVLMIGILRGERSLSDYLALKHKRQVLQTAVDSLTDEIHHLSSEIHRIEHSPEYAKRILRDKYHILGNGEQMILFDKNSP